MRIRINKSSNYHSHFAWNSHMFSATFMHSRWLCVLSATLVCLRCDSWWLLCALSDSCALLASNALSTTLVCSWRVWTTLILLELMGIVNSHSCFTSNLKHSCVLSVILVCCWWSLGTRQLLCVLEELEPLIVDGNCYLKHSYRLLCTLKEFDFSSTLVSIWPVLYR